jgi:hypothetical protein
MRPLSYSIVILFSVISCSERRLAMADLKFPDVEAAAIARSEFKTMIPCLKQEGGDCLLDTTMFTTHDRLGRKVESPRGNWYEFDSITGWPVKKGVHYGWHGESIIHYRYEYDEDNSRLIAFGTYERNDYPDFIEMMEFYPSGYLRLRETQDNVKAADYYRLQLLHYDAEWRLISDSTFRVRGGKRDAFETEKHYYSVGLDSSVHTNDEGRYTKYYGADGLFKYQVTIAHGRRDTVWIVWR